MEVHVQLATASKMFCGCSADYASAPPNTHTCPVCLGLPGVLPVINRKAVEFSLMTGLALGCTVPEFTKWDRKNYAYPDLPKGYQISQYDLPLTIEGHLEVHTELGSRRVGIRRAHLEEDTGKLIHVGDRSLIDFNRSGVPLLEIVTDPDLRSAEEARQYLVKLRGILRYLGVSSGNMEEGAMRCEANISLRPEGSSVLPEAYVEVKNLNSFRAVKQALDYEVQRQADVLGRGERVERVTMGWDEARGVTVVQRTKEEAHDYRYFPDPDLPPLAVSREWVDQLRSRLPELPGARAARFEVELGLSAADAALLADERPMADYFEAVVSVAGRSAGREAANWITGALFRLMNDTGIAIEDTRVSPERLAELLAMVAAGEVNVTTGRQVLEAMFETGRSGADIVRERGLSQIGDAARLEALAAEAVRGNPGAVEDYRAGKEQAAKFLVGQVMRATRGQANAQAVESILKRILSE